MTYFLRLLSETMHSTSSNLQFVQGAPCSTTLQRTLRERQHWQAFDALLLTLLGGRLPFDLRPASEAVRFEIWECKWIVSAGGEEDESEKLPSIESIVAIVLVQSSPVDVLQYNLRSSTVIPGKRQRGRRKKEHGNKESGSRAQKDNSKLWMAAQRSRTREGSFVECTPLGSPQGRRGHGERTDYSPSIILWLEHELSPLFEGVTCTKGWRMRREWRPPATRRLAIRPTPP